MIKKIICGALIIALIIAGVIVAKKITKEQETVNTQSNTINELNIIKEENNTVKNETIIEENKVEKETKQENIVKEKTPKEKAIEIVKNNWGEDDTVYFACEKQEDDGRYPVAVRDKNSTKALYWYYVDIETGTFDIK